jgi:hypothetical protein
LNAFITIPIWYYVIDKYGYLLKNRYKLTGHYTEIYKSLQKNVTDSYIIFIILAIITIIIGHNLILLVGRNKIERDKKREAWKLIRQQKKLLKANKVKEYY